MAVYQVLLVYAPGGWRTQNLNDGPGYWHQSGPIHFYKWAEIYPRARWIRVGASIATRRLPLRHGGARRRRVAGGRHPERHKVLVCGRRVARHAF